MSAGLSTLWLNRCAALASLGCAAALSSFMAPTTALAHDHRGSSALPVAPLHQHQAYPQGHRHYLGHGHALGNSHVQRPLPAAVIVHTPTLPPPAPAVLVTPVEPVHRVHRHVQTAQVFCLSGYTLLSAHQGCPIGTTPVAVTPLR